MKVTTTSKSMNGIVEYYKQKMIIFKVYHLI